MKENSRIGVFTFPFHPELSINIFGWIAYLLFKQKKKLRDGVRKLSTHSSSSGSEGSDRIHGDALPFMSRLSVLLGKNFQSKRWFFALMASLSYITATVSSSERSITGYLAFCCFPLTTAGQIPYIWEGKASFLFWELESLKFDSSFFPGKMIRSSDDSTALTGFLTAAGHTAVQPSHQAQRSKQSEESAAGILLLCEICLFRPNECRLDFHWLSHAVV